jgi:hypothetical protein
MVSESPLGLTRISPYEKIVFNELRTNLKKNLTFLNPEKSSSPYIQITGQFKGPNFQKALGRLGIKEIIVIGEKGHFKQVSLRL